VSSAVNIEIDFIQTQQDIKEMLICSEEMLVELLLITDLTAEKSGARSCSNLYKSRFSGSVN